MKLRLMLFALLAAVPVQAAPKWLTSLGHETKSTARDLVLLKRPAWNYLAMAEIGADFADAQTTSRVIKAGGTEQNAFLYGAHPSFGRVAATDLAISGGVMIISHWMHTHRPDPYIKTADYWWIYPQLADIGFTTNAAWSNSQSSVPAKQFPVWHRQK